MIITIILVLTCLSVKRAGHRSFKVFTGGPASTISLLRNGKVWSIFEAMEAQLGLRFFHFFNQGFFSQPPGYLHSAPQECLVGN